MSETSDFVHVNWKGQAVSIEYQWIGSSDKNAPLMIFLHEGLGSVSMWKDFPARLCRELGFRGLVYSRPGYGQSVPGFDSAQPSGRTVGSHSGQTIGSPVPDFGSAQPSGQTDVAVGLHSERTIGARPEQSRRASWAPDYMHQQAQQLLPALLKALHINTKTQPPWLFGHSDGATITLLYAARFPKQLSGAILLAPHIMVEDVSINSIEQARQAYLKTDLRQKLARYHNDPDSAFWGWNDIWLNPAFRDWSIEAEIATIQCPLLAVQGLDDEYGTLEQIHNIARHLPQTYLLELPQCRHSPHRDQPEKLIEATKQFISNTDIN